MYENVSRAEHGMLRKFFDFLREIMHVVVFSTKITGRVMFVGVEGFLRGVLTLLSFTVVLTELFPALTAASFVNDRKP